MTTGLFLLRCTQLGLSMADLDDLDMGMVLDMLTEQANDQEEYDEIATPEDYERF